MYRMSVFPITDSSMYLGNARCISCFPPEVFGNKTELSCSFICSHVHFEPVIKPCTVNSSFPGEDCTINYYSIL